MKLPVPSLKDSMTLSILFLLFSLVFYWWASGSPMPTADLARRASLRSHGLTPGPVVAQGVVHFQDLTDTPRGTAEGSRWFVSRQGDSWVLTTHEPTGPFWTHDYGWIPALTPTEESPLLTAPIQYALHYSWYESLKDSVCNWEWVTLAVCTLPDVARIQLYEGWYNLSESGGLSPRDWLLEHGSVADCTRLSPDSPFWLCQQVWNPGDGGSATLARAYDAQGNLLCEWCSYDG